MLPSLSLGAPLDHVLVQSWDKVSPVINTVPALFPMGRKCGHLKTGISASQLSE